MMVKLLSGDTPRSLVLALVLGAILIALAFAPFLFPGVRSVDTAARICVFILLVASYDLMLGYGGIVSFAHMVWRWPAPIWIAGLGRLLWGLGPEPWWPLPWRF